MAQLIRGTTPTIIFKYSDINVSEIEVAYLLIKQYNRTVIKKPLIDAYIEEDSIAWELTQSESLQLNSSSTVTIMCDWKLENGTRGRSNILTAEVEDAGINEVI